MPEFELDIASLTAPLAGDQPAGDDPEFSDDPEFGIAYREIVQLATPTPPVERNGQFKPGEPPKWREVAFKTQDLLEKSRSFELGRFMLSGMMKVDGLAGLRAGMDLLAGLAENSWPHAFPELGGDGTGPSDHFERRAKLEILGQSSPELDLFYETVVHATRMDSLTLGQMLRAAGSKAAPGEFEGEDAEAIEAAAKAEADQTNAILRSLDDEATAKLHGELASSKTAVQGFIESFNGKLGGNQDRLSLDTWISALDIAIGSVASLMGDSSGDDEGGDDGEGDDAGDESMNGGGGSTKKGGRNAGYASRSDVSAGIDRMCDYFAKNEPTSPVPLLLKRAQRLLHLDFMSLVDELAPEGRDSLLKVTGPQEEASE